MAQKKSFIGIISQMERIRKMFPEYMTNEQFNGSWLQKAYQIADRYTTNISMFQWNRDNYAQPFDIRGNELFPYAIYALSDLYKQELK